MSIDTTEIIPSSEKSSTVEASRTEGIHPEICEIASFCGSRAIQMAEEGDVPLSEANLAAIKEEFTHVTIDDRQRTDLYRYFSNRITCLMQEGGISFSNPAIQRLRQIRDAILEASEEIR